MIDILMSTYNGEKYLCYQIDSILNQDYTNWRLIIRDDGSTDSTVEIISKYREKYPHKIFFIDDKESLGPCKSFIKLLSYSTANYIMFSDQDDVWLSYKITKTLNKMIEYERINGQNVSVLVHTDLYIVDSNLKVLQDSFWKFKKINPLKDNNLNRLLVKNTVTGCTVMINNNLKKQLSEVSDDIIMHDWWFALVAKSIGNIVTLDESTILYRQHENNVVGSNSKFFKKIKKALFCEKNIFNRYPRYIKQAKYLMDCYDKQILKKEKKILIKFIQLEKVSFLERRFIFLSQKFYYRTKLFQSILQFLIL